MMLYKIRNSNTDPVYTNEQDITSVSPCL